MSGLATVEQGSERLRLVTALLVGQGARVESGADDHVVLAFGGNGMRPWMHAVHAVLTLATVGLWALVWVAHWIRARNWRRIVSVDEAGRITGSEWRAGPGGALPQIGRVMSREGVVRVEPGRRSVAIGADMATHQLTRIAPILLSDPGGGSRISLINNQWKIGMVTFGLSAPAQQPADLYYFLLN